MTWICSRSFWSYRVIWRLLKRLVLNFCVLAVLFLIFNFSMCFLTDTGLVADTRLAWLVVGLLIMETQSVVMMLMRDNGR